MASTYTVQRGDTLWGIAQTYLGDPYKYTYLAQINNIPNPRLIYVGQVIKLSAGGTSSSTVTPSPPAPKKATINQFGLQADTDRTVFATWNWSTANTDHFKIRWWYRAADGVAILGSESTTEFNHSTYNAPQNAERAWFHVMPISKTYTSNGNNYYYWQADWSDQVTYEFKNNPPTEPPVPTVTIKNYTLTAEVDNLDVNGTDIQFQIVKDDITVFNSGTAKIILNHASYSCKVDAGSNYKVRCRAVRDTKYSDWTDYSSNVGTPPATPERLITCRAASKTSVYLEWSAVQNAETYDIEYTTNKNYFDNSDGTTVQTGIEFNHMEKTGLETGQEYFFRVRAVNEDGESGWSEIKSCNIGSDPAAPTTWSSTTTAIVGDPLNLYWVHNSADGSSQTYAELEIYINGRKETYTIENTKDEDEDEKDKTSVYPIDTSKYVEGTKIQWRVRTAGVTKAYGDWSVQRTVDIYAPPTLQLKMTDSSSNGIQTLTSFPFYISALAGPKTQSPIGYQLTITSKQYYETVDDIGNRKIINEGDEVYSRYFDITEALLVELSAHNIDLENNIEYTVSCSVTMNSGLTTSSSLEFNVMWDETIYTPNAAISIDEETIVAYIRPYCEIYPTAYYKVNHVDGTYVATDEVIEDEIEGISIDDLTDTGEIVYEADGSGGEKIYFRIALAKEAVLVDDVSLSVYRREFDGSFTEIATDLINTRNTYVTDPHPALDYARYRIVATTISTGAVSYYDVPGVPTGEKGIIIQWDEEWSEFNTTSEEPLAEPPWSGSMLKLPYNIDVSDSNDSDVSLVKYVGRKHPVSYYGTQIGSSSVWNVDIDKSDKDTLYALRRLSIWMGDVYVREPSGSGYWANIKVSFSQTHRELTIPVTLDLTRVEGGV